VSVKGPILHKLGGKTRLIRDESSKGKDADLPYSGVVVLSPVGYVMDFGGIKTNKE